jgi:hypothetical protein
MASQLTKQASTGDVKKLTDTTNSMSQSDSDGMILAGIEGGSRTISWRAGKGDSQE